MYDDYLEEGSSNEGIAWALALFVVGFFIFAPLTNTGRYESSSSNGKLFVVDKQTGEVWVSSDVGQIDYEPEKMVPVEYEKKGQWNSDAYTPEESRNDSNSSWGTAIKKFFKK